MPSNESGIVESLRTYRAEEGLTLVELADRLGVTYRSLISYYYRKRRPSPGVGFRIEESTGGRVSMRDFYPSDT